MANLQCYHSNVPTTSTCRLGTKIIQIFFWTPFNVLFKRNKDVNPTRNVCMDQFTVSSLDRLPLLYTWRCACVCMGRGTRCVVYDSLLTTSSNTEHKLFNFITRPTLKSIMLQNLFFSKHKVQFVSQSGNYYKFSCFTACMHHDQTIAL